LALYLPAVAGVALALIGWIALARALARRGRSRWRAVLLCLPPLVGSAVYGLFWAAFFSSPGMAVQMHAIRLTIQHAVGPWPPWIAGAWLAAALALLWPLARRR
jgi:hypothetical protein